MRCAVSFYIRTRRAHRPHGAGVVHIMHECFIVYVCMLHRQLGHGVDSVTRQLLTSFESLQSLTKCEILDQSCGCGNHDWLQESCTFESFTWVSCPPGPLSSGSWRHPAWWPPPVQTGGHYNMCHIKVNITDIALCHYLVDCCFVNTTPLQPHLQVWVQFRSNVCIHRWMTWSNFNTMWCFQALAVSMAMGCSQLSILYE